MDVPEYSFSGVNEALAHGCDVYVGWTGPGGFDLIDNVIVSVIEEDPNEDYRHCGLSTEYVGKALENTADSFEGYEPCHDIPQTQPNALDYLVRNAGCEVELTQNGGDVVLRVHDPQGVAALETGEPFEFIGEDVEAVYRDAVTSESLQQAATTLA